MSMQKKFGRAVMKGDLLVVTGPLATLRRMQAAVSPEMPQALAGQRTPQEQELHDKFVAASEALAALAASLQEAIDE